MTLPQEELNEWAETLHALNSPCLEATDAARAGNAQRAGEIISGVRGKLHRLANRLVRAGAVDPHAAAVAALAERMQAAGMAFPTPKETPPELLSSEKTKQFVEAMRAAAVACEAMEKERGIEDGLTEMLCDFADGAEFECYGPVGLRGME